MKFKAMTTMIYLPKTEKVYIRRLVSYLPLCLHLNCNLRNTSYIFASLDVSVYSLTRTTLRSRDCCWEAVSSIYHDDSVVEWNLRLHVGRFRFSYIYLYKIYSYTKDNEREGSNLEWAIPLRLSAWWLPVSRGMNSTFSSFLFSNQL